MKTVIRTFPVELIRIGERYRPLCEDAVARLQASLAAIGLRQPITVWIAREGGREGEPVVVAGRHRLEAAKRLGWATIAAIDVGSDPLVAELWELGENLHRHELSREERDRHIRRYAEILEFQSQQTASIESKRRDGRGHRPEGTASKVAKATGLSKDTVRRALSPPKPPAPAPVPAPTLNGHAGVAPAARPRQNSISGATRSSASSAASDEAYRALHRTWKRADKGARARFLQDVAGAPLPLFDRPAGNA